MVFIVFFCSTFSAFMVVALGQDLGENTVHFAHFVHDLIVSVFAVGLSAAFLVAGLTHWGRMRAIVKTQRETNAGMADGLTNDEIMGLEAVVNGGFALSIVSFISFFIRGVWYCLTCYCFYFDRQCTGPMCMPVFNDLLIVSYFSTEVVPCIFLVELSRRHLLFLLHYQ